MLPKILVLEDATERIDWLRQFTAGKARVVWALGVTSFRKLYGMLRDDLSLIILDHDLGLSRADALSFNPVTGIYTHHYDPCAGGPKNLDGTDAARWLATFGWEIPCPVLVWSWNLDPAKAMSADLVRARTKRVWQMPFEANSAMLRVLIGGAIQQPAQEECND